MGYRYVFYQQGMENDPLSDNLHFYLESPEYTIYKRTLSLNRTYPEKDVRFYEQHCTVSEPDQQFPRNMATGWFFNETDFSVELDFRNKDVVNWAVQEILKKVREIESRNPKFKFAGFAWDVPQLTGDFWSAPAQKGGKQVTLEYWQSKNQTLRQQSKPSYTRGRTAYYQVLFAAMRQRYPDARIIMEPAKIYDDWVKVVATHNVPDSIMPDLLCQEASDLKFVSDPRILSSGKIKKSQLASTTPNVFGEVENRTIAATMAINGAWFSWYGRFGGTGNMPDFKNIAEVPARLKLIRVLPNWENLNDTPLNDRIFLNNEYKSPTAGMSSGLLWGRKPGTNDILCVFLSLDEAVQFPVSNKEVQIYQLDSLMGPSKNAEKMFRISNRSAMLRDSTRVGEAFLFRFK
ncbi:hypothetical protein [Dyadobacter fermentans]|nr:hypothetical protein [Dyadobacter fermentans]